MTKLQTFILDLYNINILLNKRRFIEDNNFNSHDLILIEKHIKDIDNIIEFYNENKYLSGTYKRLGESILNRYKKYKENK